MNTILIIFSTLAFAAVSLNTRIFQLKYLRNDRDTDLFQSLFCIVSGIAYILQSGLKCDLSALQFFCAVLFGMFLALACMFMAFCFRCGPMSLTSVIVNCSVAFPIIYSCAVLREKVTYAQLCGFILLIITFTLSAFQSGGDVKKINPKWIVFVLIAFFSNGITAVIQKQYKISAPESDGNAFMSLAYFTAAGVLLLSFSIQKKLCSNISEKGFHFSIITALLITITGLASFIGNGVLLNLSVKVPAALLYPCVNGGLCVTVSIFSILLFSEKLTLKKAMTIVFGLASVIVFNL